MRKQLTVGSLMTGRPQANITRSESSPVPSQSPSRPRLARPSHPETFNQTVRVKQRDQEYDVRYASCQTLLQAAIEQGQPLAYKCQQGYCGKCSVQLITGSSLLAPPTNQEQEKLGSKLSQGYRLACQSSFRSTIAPR
jgi:ferredoxin